MVFPHMVTPTRTGLCLTAGCHVEVQNAGIALWRWRHNTQGKMGARALTKHCWSKALTWHADRHNPGVSPRAFSSIQLHHDPTQPRLVGSLARLRALCGSGGHLLCSQGTLGGRMQRGTTRPPDGPYVHCNAPRWSICALQGHQMAHMWTARPPDGPYVHYKATRWPICGLQGHQMAHMCTARPPDGPYVSL